MSNEHGLHPGIFLEERCRWRHSTSEDRWDFRPAYREQTLQRQLDRPYSCPSAGAHWRLL